VLNGLRQTPHEPCGIALFAQDAAGQTLALIVRVPQQLALEAVGRAGLPDHSQFRALDVDFMDLVALAPDTVIVRAVALPLFTAAAGLAAANVLSADLAGQGFKDVRGCYIGGRVCFRHDQ
jgi:hypothetical protein